MSGGYFNYIQYRLDEVYADLCNLIDTGIDKDGVKKKFAPETFEKFKEAKFEIKKATVMIKNIDYLLCWDSDEDSFLEEWESDLKAVKELKRRLTNNEQ